MWDEIEEMNRIYLAYCYRAAAMWLFAIAVGGTIPLLRFFFVVN